MQFLLISLWIAALSFFCGLLGMIGQWQEGRQVRPPRRSTSTVTFLLPRPIPPPDNGGAAQAATVCRTGQGALGDQRNKLVIALC